MYVDDPIVLPWFSLNAYRIPLPAAFTEAVGELVVGWGAFENDIARDLALMKHFALARDLSKKPQKAFKPAIGLWKQTVQTLFPQIALYRAIADDLHGTAISLAGRRNKIIHGQWQPNFEKDSPSWIVFMETGFDRSKVDGFYLSEEQLKQLNADIAALRIKFVEFIVNRHWHAQLGLLAESHEPTSENPAHIVMRADRLSLCGELDPKVPEKFANTLLFKHDEA